MRVMNNKKYDSIRSAYRKACNAYADAFCEKHGYFKLGESEDVFWVCDHPGTVLFIGDVSVDMATITEDIDREAPNGEFIKWYDYTLDMMSNGDVPMNYRSWLDGLHEALDNV